MNKLRRLLWLFLGLFILVLLVPSIIVVSFSSDLKQLSKNTVEIEKSEKSESNTKLSSDSSIEVSVYRTSSQEIEEIQLEEYIVGVVASEMPASFELEALKAQSLLARTFLVQRMLSGSKIGMPKNVDVDITDNHNYHQAYKNKDELAKQWGENYNSYILRIQEAVEATKGQILTYKEDPIDATYFSTSNGYTENSEDFWENKIAYLRSVESPWDKKSPKFNGQKVLTFEEVEKALDIELDPNADNIGEKKLTKTNRVATIRIADKELKGRFVREKLNLVSSDFDVEQKDSHLIFTTRGNGHGVGMSQYGANGMAEEGKNL